MLINPINQIIQKIADIAATHDTNKTQQNSSASASDKKNNALAGMYNVNNMSLNDLKDMIHFLNMSGKLSNEDSKTLATEQSMLERFGGLSQHVKVDMINIFQNQVDNKKLASGDKEVENAARALEILKGVKASSEAQIPTFV